MSQITLLIQPSDIISLTTLDGNIDIDNLKPMIFIAQTAHLKSFLGIPLYDKIYADFVAETLTGVYQTIYEDYVKDFLSYYSSALYVNFGGIKVSENGNYRVSAENVVPLDKDDADRLRLAYMDLVSNIEGNFKEFVKDKNLPELVNETINTIEGLPWY